jgi:dolichol kinase
VPATLRHELARKAIHLASAAVPAAYAAGVPRPALLAALAAAGLVAASVEAARRRSARAGAAFDRLVGGLLRAHERERWSGATWMCAAYALAVLVFPRREAVAAMLAVAVGDAAAAVVGRAAGARRAARAARRAAAGPVTPVTPGVGHPGARPGAPADAKTWEGSVACAAATVLAALLVARLPAAGALACGAAAALAERPRGPLDDNVRVAAAAGAAAWLAGALARGHA